MKPNKQKSKFRKSDSEKVSPLDKKTKTFKSDTTVLKMASIDSPEDVTTVPTTEWKKMMDKIETIGKQTEEISGIKSSVDNLKKDFDKKYENLEERIKDYNDRMDNVEKKLKDLDKAHELGLLEREMKATEAENHSLKEQLLTLESYSRRNNLIFEGIKEEGQNTISEVFKFLCTVLGYTQQECDNLLIANCHRLGKKVQSTKPRPLIVRFALDTQRNDVWLKTHLLKKTGFIIREDFPNEVTNRRKFMYPLYIEAKKKDRTVKLNGDKIVFRRKTYSYNEAFELAETLHFLDKGVRNENNLTAFHGQTSIFSNFFPCKFREGTVTYNCSEQMYQNELCLFFGDPHAAKAVMLHTDPVMMKKIGDKVMNNDVNRKHTWLSHQTKNKMKTAIYLKFSQNPSLMKHLKEAQGKLSEANPHDSIWGTGIALKDDRILDPSNWTGTNWLGDILTDLKEKLQ